MAVFPRVVVALGAALAWLVIEGRAAEVSLAVDHFDEEAYAENSIITSLNNCPLCRGKEPCLMDCRQKERNSWSECLNRCLGDNPLLLETFTSIVNSTSG